MRFRTHHLLLLLLPCLDAWGQQTGLSSHPARVIHVSGAADVKVKPDTVTLTLGVDTRRPTLEEAKRENDSRLEAVVEFLRSQGIPSSSIQTDYVGIHPSYDWNATTVVRHFSVQRTLIVVLRDPAQFDEVLSGAVSRGITTVQGASFRTRELKRHRETARELAVKAALEKADKLSALVGAKRGKVTSMQESTGGGWSSWSPGYWGGRSNYGGGSQVSYTPPSSASSDDSPQTLALGEIVVTASVNMTFELE